MLFSVRVTNHQNNLILNICDSHLLGKKIVDDKITMNISKSYYCERFVDKETVSFPTILIEELFFKRFSASSFSTRRSQ